MLNSLSKSTSIEPGIKVEWCAITAEDYQAIHSEQLSLRDGHGRTRKAPIEPAVAPPAVESKPPQPIWKRLCGWLIVIIVGAGLVYWFPTQIAALFLGLVKYVILLTVLFGASYLYTRRKYRDAYRQSPTAQHRACFEVWLDGVLVQQEGQQTYWPWNALYRIRRISYWLLLYTSVEDCYYLDLRQVQLPATSADLLALLRLAEVRVA